MPEFRFDLKNDEVPNGVKSRALQKVYAYILSLPDPGIIKTEAATSSLPNRQEIDDAVKNADPSEVMDEHGGPASDNPVSSHPLGEDVPPLPAYARLDEEQEYQAHSVGDWLDLYVDFASKASPMTPTSFHRAVGLFTGSLAIARRLCLRVSISQNTIYPNLYLLFIGQSTRPRKTTGLRVNHGLIKEAGMDNFLLAGRQTPEALTLDLSLQVPPSFEEWREVQRKKMVTRTLCRSSKRVEARPKRSSSSSSKSWALGREIVSRIQSSRMIRSIN